MMTTTTFFTNEQRKCSHMAFVDTQYFWFTFFTVKPNQTKLKCNNSNNSFTDPDQSKHTVGILPRGKGCSKFLEILVT